MWVKIVPKYRFYIICIYIYTCVYAPLKGLRVRVHLNLQMKPKDEKKPKDRGPKDHVNTSISHSGSKAQYREDTRKHVVWDLCVYVFFFGPLS